MPDVEINRPQADAHLDEAQRLMRICNACRYCEGICPVFPAMARRRDFAAEDLNQLANLCHNCGACYHDCQYAPPHEFAVVVPVALARVRADSYAGFAWPGALAPLFARNGVTVAAALVLGVALLLAACMAWADAGAMFGAGGDFYAVLPHNVMVAIFGAAFGFAVLALVMGLRNFWRGTGGGAVPWRLLPRALHEATTLRHLHGGGAGCGNATDRPEPWRRRFHHMTFYGFLLCFAATSVATLYHYAGLPAPYPFWSLPVLLGTVGGVGITVGPLGLYALKRQRPPELGTNADHRGMDVAFLLVLAGIGITGLALLALRDTGAMGSLLALHLGLVLGFFVTMPYGKFVHGFYRIAALLRDVQERGQ